MNRTAITLVFVLGVLAAALFVASSTGAANLSVVAVGTSFQPSNLTVAVGDTVTWSGITGAHTVTASSANWTIDSAADTSFTFTQSGTYDYFCRIHGPTMNGHVVVQASGATATNTPAPTKTPVPPTNTPAPTSTPIPLTTVVAHVSLPLVAKTGGVSSGEVAVYQGTFYPKTITVKAGTTVHWVDQATSHTVTSEATKPDGTRLFNSDTVYPDGIKPGQEYAVTFSEPGTYAYFCEFHGAPGGVGHAGTVVVTS